jgi:hypothetical protein
MPLGKRICVLDDAIQTDLLQTPCFFPTHVERTEPPAKNLQGRSGPCIRAVRSGETASVFLSLSSSNHSEREASTIYIYIYISRFCKICCNFAKNLLGSTVAHWHETTNAALCRGSSTTGLEKPTVLHSYTHTNCRHTKTKLFGASFSSHQAPRGFVGRVF